MDVAPTRSPPKVKIRKYTNLQCAQVLEHYFPGRTEGKDERVARPAQALKRELKLEDKEGRFHDHLFESRVELHNVRLAEVARINSNLANWTLKTHEGALLKLLQGFDLQNSLQAEESHCASILRQLILSQHILPTHLIHTPPALERLQLIEDRIREAVSPSKGCEPPLSDAGVWKEKAIGDWIKAWKVEKEVIQIFYSNTRAVAPTRYLTSIPISSTLLYTNPDWLLQHIWDKLRVWGARGWEHESYRPRRVELW